MDKWSIERNFLHLPNHDHRSIPFSEAKEQTLSLVFVDHFCDAFNQYIKKNWNEETYIVLISNNFS